MNEQSNFNHIKITPSEEEDVVIHAGSTRRSRDQEQKTQVQETQIQEHQERQEREALGEVPGEVEVPREAPIRKKQSAQGQKASRSTDASDSYKETTLDDIKSSKMSTTQKVIIVIAILAVIAFIVYSILFN